MFETIRSVMRLRRPRIRPVERRLARAASVADLRELARRRVPGGVFDYIDGGAGDERTLRRNAEAFTEWEFRPRVLRDVGAIDCSTQVVGDSVAFPFILAPTGFTRIASPEGELAAARAAARAGVPYVLSTLATRSIEEIAACSGGRKWFQVYVWKDRGVVREMLERAAAAQFEAICITVDFAKLGRRERDVRRGFTLPPQLGLDTLLDGIRHPHWTQQFVRSDPIRFANVTSSHVGDGTTPVDLADYVDRQLEPGLTWDDIAWFREQWPGKIILKGIQHEADAAMAPQYGADAVVLSNHGGRQLDGSPAPLDLLAQVVRGACDDIDIIVDGGVRRGSDVAKAVALGARCAMGGRAYLYGLAAGGEAGVDLALTFLHDEFESTLALCGARSVAELSPLMVGRVGDLAVSDCLPSTS